MKVTANRAASRDIISSIAALLHKILIVDADKQCSFKSLYSKASMLFNSQTPQNYVELTSSCAARSQWWHLYSSARVCNKPRQVGQPLLGPQRAVFMLCNWHYRPALCCQHSPHRQRLSQRPPGPAAGVLRGPFWVQSYRAAAQHNCSGHAAQEALLVRLPHVLERPADLLLPHKADRSASDQGIVRNT